MALSFVDAGRPAARKRQARPQVRAADQPDPLRLLLVTDAWTPQINGVSRTYEWLSRALPDLGVDLHLLTPQGYRTIPMPSYPAIRLALPPPRSVPHRIAAIAPHIVHIATEGPIGLLARLYCHRRRIPFTTCFHTRYPEYIAARWPIPERWSYAALRWFHNGAAATMAATQALAGELRGHGFARMVHWKRGVDTKVFAEGPMAQLDLPRPWFLFAGRLAVEKNIEAFLELDLPGTKIVAGDGPARAMLQQKYPQVRFLGALSSADLGAVYRAADVFVFPRRADTFAAAPTRSVSSWRKP